MHDRRGIAWLSLTEFGLGYLTPASGTWGSIPPVLVAALLIIVGCGPGSFVYIPVLVGLMILFAAACVIWGDEAEARWGKDPKQVVADEVAGQIVPLLLMPTWAGADVQRTTFLLLTAFFAFRFFDIAKVEPANSLQRIVGGWGVLLDDLAAGCYAAIVVVVVGSIIQP